jgi:hypothetical protein
MLVNEVISAEGKLELWRMISDSMWGALDAQARAELAAKAERDAVRKPRKRSARAAKPKSVPMPAAAAPLTAKPSSSTAASTPATQQPPIQPSTPVQQSSAMAAGVQQATAANAEVATAAKPKPNMPQGGALLARARGVLDNEF